MGLKKSIVRLSKSTIGDWAKRRGPRSSEISTTKRGQEEISARKRKEGVSGNQ